ncbi:hypothetical protein OPT61_g221 [Boeremia exigua]|uniref:Uncharacterized protein n=1 Tax=Boeremia exigua TaxID=749465 RepID=A0ACC2IUL6_9PLEO|nr:hypothetical protein OPT61_g221 [Boeremia exigua]
MGADAGFDMVPRLSNGVDDKHKWQQFIESVEDHYKDDTKVVIHQNYIQFKAGEHPLLPFEGHKFLRFSSKITGPNAARTGVEGYIKTVTRLARVHFGTRIQYWNELFDAYGEHGWAEVNESIDSYTQSDEPDRDTRIGSPSNQDHQMENPGMPLFEIRDIPGKGRGLVARVEISVGTRVLCEEPILTSQHLSPANLEQDLAMRLKKMPKTSQRQFLSLHNNFPGRSPFSNTFKTNALPCGIDSPIGAVYPTIYLINHSCIANCHHSWNGLLEKETIHAVRPIAAGDEITISYNEGGTHDVRRRRLREDFGFTCDCASCVCNPADREASDARRLLIQTLDDAIGDPMRMMTRPAQSLSACQSLLRVLEDEFKGFAGVLNARLYYDAFQVCIAHGDQARAGVFADRSWATRVVCEGGDSPETMRMQALSRQPKSHSSFELCSTKWRTKVGAAPEGLSAESFEKWLFRV